MNTLCYAFTGKIQCGDILCMTLMEKCVWYEKYRWTWKS